MIVEYGPWSLDEAIWNAIEIWADTRREFWEQVDDEKARMGQHAGEVLADLTLKASDELSHMVLPESFSDILEVLADSDVVLEPLELAVAKRLSTDVRAKARRCLELAVLVVEGKPSEHVLRYLRRLSRCYTAGFEAEAVIMCRAVLENAIRDAFSRKKLPLPRDQRGRSTMASRIQAAVRFNILPAKLAPDATTVWKRGSKAAHEDPQVTKDILGTIQMTMAVVAALYEI